jgi:hypothetical protein
MQANWQARFFNELAGPVLKIPDPKGWQRFLAETLSAIEK